MNRILQRVVIGAIASAVVGGMASAQTVEEVTVRAARVPTVKVVGRSASGAFIREISLTYGVTTAGLDLATSAGADALAKRVHAAADAACKEIGQKYPDSTPSDRECARLAADKAMDRVHELVAAAQKGAAK
jgi:UrcA family protein